MGGACDDPIVLTTRSALDEARGACEKRPGQVMWYETSCGDTAAQTTVGCIVYNPK
jgi:hypothetical protein